MHSNILYIYNYNTGHKWNDKKFHDFRTITQNFSIRLHKQPAHVVHYHRERAPIKSKSESLIRHRYSCPLSIEIAREKTSRFQSPLPNPRRIKSHLSRMARAEALRSRLLFSSPHIMKAERGAPRRPHLLPTVCAAAAAGPARGRARAHTEILADNSY